MQCFYVPQNKLWITSHGKASEKYWYTITKPVEVNHFLLQRAEAWILKNWTFMYIFLLSQMSDSFLYIMPLSNCEFPENWRKKSLIYWRLSIKFCTFALFCPIWVKFCSGKVYKNLLGDSEFYENQCTESHTRVWS